MSHRCGLYRALVANTADPLGLYRIQVSCPQLWGPDNTTDWLSSIYPPARMPHIGSVVWIAFEAGDEDNPIWFGSPV
jgi:hypothetical protein